MFNPLLVRRVIVVGLTLGAIGASPLRAQAPASVSEDLGVKYMRDSEEYAALARQSYRMAGEAVTRAAAAGRTPWTVVLDIDETALDNSAYELERAAYHLPYDPASWNAWVSRREAGAVPGAVEFVALVRRAGGHVAWITNRDPIVNDATRANLKQLDLWTDDDRLCGRKTPEHTKGMRRAEVVSGTGDCSWSGVPMHVAVFVGDQMGDFPVAAEHIAGTGADDDFGRTCFLVPNAMYGDWVASVTRVRQAPPP
jgi:5'-nucleotidase (lipoprotein e(P4) family)